MNSASDAGSTQFSVADLLARASAETGLTDFGDEEFREGFSRLVDSTNNDIVITPVGAVAFQAEVHSLLVNRLRFAADLKKHPEILDEQMPDPIIVLGLPRTGTTKLQRMLASDPGFQSLKFWQTLNPSRFPNAVPGQEDPRIEAARQSLAMMAQMAPGILQSHPIQVNDAEEEIFLQLLTFKTIATTMAHPAPSHYEWASRQPMDGTYRYMKQLLQYLQWQDGGRRGRPWILKTPVHLGCLDMLVEHFPKATYVFPHRDPRQSMPSFCRLLECYWRVKMDDVDLDYLGRFVLDIWADEMRKHMAQRDLLGSKAPIYDVPYEHIRDRPIDVLREVYRRAGRELGEQQVAAIGEWERQDAYGSFGNYSYSLEQYGLTGEAVDAAFSEYRRRYLS